MMLLDVELFTVIYVSIFLTVILRVNVVIALPVVSIATAVVTFRRHADVGKNKVEGIRERSGMIDMVEHVRCNDNSG